MFEKKILKIFYKIYTKKYLSTVSVIVLMFLNSLFIYISAGILAKIYDNSKEGNLNNLLFLCGILFFMWIIIKIIDNVSNFYIKITSEKLCLRLIYQVMEKIIYSEYSWISKREKGEILQVLIDDIDQFKDLNVDIIPRFLYAVILSLTSSVFLYQLNPLLLLIAVIIYPLCILPVLLLAKLQQKKYLEIRNVNENLKQYLLQIFDNIKDIKIFNKEDNFIKRYYEKQKKWCNKLFQIHFINSMTKNIPRIISALVPTIVYITGGYFYFRNEVSVGKLLVSTAIVSNLYTPVRMFSTFYTGIKKLGAISEKLYRFLEAPAEKKYELPRIEKLTFEKLELIDINFFYDREIIFSNLSFKINKGEKILLLGETGSGKTTLINLISGLTDPAKGKIILNDSIDLKNLNCLDWHEILGVIYQKPNLYSKDLHSNLYYLKKNKELNINIPELIEKMSLSKIFERNDDIGEAIQSISAGQAQRLGIARMLLCQKDIFIFDEPTGNQDTETEEKILNYIFYERCKENTIIFTSHKLSSIKYATKILFLKNKRISGFDTHENLLKNNNDYSEYIFCRKI